MKYMLLACALLSSTAAYSRPSEFGVTLVTVGLTTDGAEVIERKDMGRGIDKSPSLAEAMRLCQHLRHQREIVYWAPAKYISHAHFCEVREERGA